MEKVFKDYLFSKHILVSENGKDENAFETLFTIANMFSIRITEGQELAEREMIEYISSMVGVDVPKPFYKGFPESVKKLSTDELIFDQMIHYITTYGLGNFSEAGHSLFEEQFERTAFKEKAEIKDFVILKETDAAEKLKGYVYDLFLGTRPLNPTQYEVVSKAIDVYDIRPENCASKNLAIRLLAEKRDVYYAKFLALSDVIKLVEEINYRSYDNTDVKKLNLKNQDRKLITSVIDHMFINMAQSTGDDGEAIAHNTALEKEIKNCFERKALWSGVLHHIHYKAVNSLAAEFTDLMRGKTNDSVYSAFEKEIGNGSIANAVKVLKEGKGSGAILRNLDYLISRCKNEDDVETVLESIQSNNIIILIQLLMKYSGKTSVIVNRTFKFTKFERLKVYTETEEEVKKRKSFLTKEQTEQLRSFVDTALRRVLENRLNKVYIDEDMKNYALPLSETSASGGLGVLAKGSRVHIDTFSKIRAFTYWEKVNDIDLSAFGITEDGKRIEFSWRTMAGNQSDAIIYSGDQTSGYNGGSEYFDIKLESFRRMYPEVRYIVFCNNVFSPVRFCDCFCKAGYMIRELNDSGQVFEPKTVASSYIINSDSTYAYLFGLDLDTNDLIWLNMNKDSYDAVAGESPFGFLIDYFYVTDTMNVKSFFEMMATELVTDISQADVVVSDKVNEADLKSGTKLIHSYDFEKITALMG
ncbi:MAG: TerD family protein [Lachnospiraceae bacterium]|nr:TerD family protein [Lachnospiraceae bacterium]